MTEKVKQFSNRFVQTICDVKIYSGFEKAPAKGKGFRLFDGAILKNFSHLAIEEEGSLSNFISREHFFTIAYFKVIKNTKNMKELILFQSNNKYLFMGYNQLK